MTLQGYYLTATAQPNGCFAVMASAIYQPFNNATNIIGSTGAGKSNISLSTSYAATQSGIGYQELQSLYSQYKVRWAKFRAVGSATNGADQFTIAAYPATTQITSTAMPPVDAQPYAKDAMCVSGSKPQGFEISMDCPTVMGYSNVQWEGIAPTLVGNTPSSVTQWFYNFCWQVNTPGNPASSLAFLFNLWQEVEFSEPVAFST